MIFLWDFNFKIRVKYNFIDRFNFERIEILKVEFWIFWFFGLFLV